MVFVNLTRTIENLYIDPDSYIKLHQMSRLGQLYSVVTHLTFDFISLISYTLL